ncbi:MAG: type IV secretion protein IcmD [Legionellales bacterium]|jgi:intracellular multiplication protein IcmD|nr:type IV secretion protein IcmD [Legionellales bacterium]
MSRFALLLLSFIPAFAFAEIEEVGLGHIAVGLLHQYKYFASLILGTAFIAGLCFFVAALFKFKQHKDNPAQVTIGTPFAMIAISVGLIFLPSFIKPTGESLFGVAQTVSSGVSGDISQLPGASPSDVETYKDFA